MSGGVGQLVMNGPLILAVPLAAAAGAITFISPCCLPLIPGYLSYVTGMSGAESGGPDPAALPLRDQRGGPAGGLRHVAAPVAGGLAAATTTTAAAAAVAGTVPGAQTRPALSGDTHLGPVGWL